MRPRKTFPAAMALAIPLALLCQLPPAGKLSPADSKLFQQEIHRLQHLLETAGDKDTVMFQLAGTWASGGEYREAIDALAGVLARKVGLDPSNDVDFAKLRGTREYEQLLRQVRESTPPVLNSRPAFTIGQPDLAPEGIAWHPGRKRLYLGSTYQHSILECSPAGACRTFVQPGQDGLAEVLGLRIDLNNGSLWAASNTDAESALFHFAVPSGTLVRKYVLSHKPEGHVFNDLALNSKGDVFVTDTRGGTVYTVSRKTDRLELLNLALKVPSANGIAISGNDRYLYVAGFGDGITIVDLTAGTFRAIAHPAELCLATIDGLYFYKNSLIAIQNGIMTARVVRYYLTLDLNRIERFEILERRNPLFKGITTGAIADDAFYFMSNALERAPTQILKLGL